MEARTDRNNNPIAFTTDIANQAGLELGKDYEVGDSFGTSPKFYTAKLIGDPLQICVRVIDKIGFYTKGGWQRWIYIGIPDFIWGNLDIETKIRVIKFMYQHEGGTELMGLFS